MADVIATPNAPAALGPYSQGRICGNLVFVSGQLGAEANGALPSSFEEQARNCLKSLSAILEAGGSSLAKVQKATVFLSDMENFTALNAVYAEYFTAPYPARSCFEVARLPKDALVEIEVIAER